MTTLACNLKEMAGDTRVTQEGIGGDAFQSVKLFAGKDSLFAVTGENCTGSLRALEWLQGEQLEDRRPQPPEYEHDWSWSIVELSEAGIAVYNEYLEREQTLEPILALGSGRKVALYCMKYLHMSPAEAVREACKVDHHSELPIYTASLADLEVRLWRPEKKTKREKPGIVVKVARSPHANLHEMPQEKGIGSVPPGQVEKDGATLPVPDLPQRKK